MKGVNKVILVGNMGAAPESKTTKSGKAVAQFSVATTERWTDKATGQKQERTEWHQCTAFDRLAEIIIQYGGKGQAVYIEGQNRTRKWTSQGGEDHYSTSVNVSEFQIIHDPNYVPNQNGQNPAPVQHQRTNQNGTATSPYAQNPQTGVAPPPPVDSFDDDIPF